MNDLLDLLDLPPERLVAVAAVLAAALAALRVAGRLLGPVVLRRAPRLHAALATAGAIALALGPDLVAALRARAPAPAVPPGERTTQPDPLRPPRLPPLPVLLVLVALGAGCATTEQREQTATTVGLVYRTVRKVCSVVMRLPAPPPLDAGASGGESLLDAGAQ